MKKKTNKSRGPIAVAPSNRKSASIEKVKNGYIVSSWDGDKDIKVICRDAQEAEKVLMKMMKV